MLINLVYPPGLRISKKVFSPTSVETTYSSLEVPVDATFSSSEVPVDTTFSLSEVQVDVAFSLKEVAILDKTYVAGNRKNRFRRKMWQVFGIEEAMMR